MKNFRKSKYNALAAFFIFTILLIAIIPLTVNAADPTIVSINPSSQTVSSGNYFNVYVNCTPGQPIKSFEFKISYDASLLQANTVSEGGIFNGYTTFFNAGTINNTAGTIVDIYGLIMGSGNVSDPGSFVNLNFSAKNSTGSSQITIYDVGITNEIEYIPITVNNGTVQVDATPPNIIDNSPTSGYTGDIYIFNASITDNVNSAGELTVLVDWSHGSNGNNESMTHVGNNYFVKTVTLDQDSISDLTYSIIAEDEYGNSNTTAIASVTIQDNDPPQISSVSASPSSQEVNDYVNITTTITDNIEINDVFLNITYPNSIVENFSIIANKTGTTYYCNRTYSAIGSYNYYIWVKDTSNNGNFSSSEVFIIGDQTSPEISNTAITTSNPLDITATFGWVNITCDVTDNVAVNNVYLNISNPDGSWNNVSMNIVTGNSYYYNSSTVFSQYGNYSYIFWANDTSGNNVASSSNAFSMPPNWDINNDGECKVFDFVLISNHYGETGSAGWIREDVDNNGQIQVLDLTLISNYYDESWWV